MSQWQLYGTERKNNFENKLEPDSLKYIQATHPLQNSSLLVIVLCGHNLTICKIRATVFFEGLWLVFLH